MIENKPQTVVTLSLKEVLLNKLNELEVKAAHYCRTDWERYNTLLAEIKDIDAKLLDIYDKENIAWLAKKKA